MSALSLSRDPSAVAAATATALWPRGEVFWDGVIVPDLLNLRQAPGWAARAQSRSHSGVDDGSGTVRPPGGITASGSVSIAQGVIKLLQNNPSSLIKYVLRLRPIAQSPLLTRASRYGAWMQQAPGIFMCSEDTAKL